MARNEEILQELQEKAPGLQGLSLAMPYALPDDYFVRFPGSMLLKVQVTKMPMAVPDGYFESFAEKMLAKVKTNEIANELEEVAPLLNGITKTMPYQIPDGYFDNFEQLQKESIQPKGGRVIGLFGPKVRQWAAAAAIAMGLLWGGWWLSTRSTETTSYAATPSGINEIEQLATLEDGVIIDYLDVEDDYMLEFATMLFNEDENIENKLQTIQTNDLISYLNGSTFPNPHS